MKANMPNSKISIKEAVRKEVDAYFDKRSLDYDASVMFILNKYFGFGKDRLRRFYTSYAKEIKKDLKDYEDEITFDKIYQYLKSIGVDVKEWDKQVNG